MFKKFRLRPQALLKSRDYTCDIFLFFLTLYCLQKVSINPRVSIGPLIVDGRRRGRNLERLAGTSSSVIIRTTNAPHTLDNRRIVVFVNTNSTDQTEEQKEQRRKKQNTYSLSTCCANLRIRREPPCRRGGQSRFAIGRREW